jgi:nucleoside-diphosphate-sugar epimerase
MGSRFSSKDIAAPKDSYGVSKYLAEKKLWEVSAKTGLEVVVVRLPLVYGYGAKGNLKRLVKLIKTNIPLPFNLINNKRSLIGIDNLADVLIRCIYHTEAKGKTFLVSDGEDLSTPGLIKYLASAMNYSIRLFSFPVFLLKFFGFILGRKSEVNRIIDSLQIDNSYVREVLNWMPPVSVEEGIKRMIKKNDTSI